jgi:hypothetical protein
VNHKILRNDRVHSSVILNSFYADIVPCFYLKINKNCYSIVWPSCCENEALVTFPSRKNKYQTKFSNIHDNIYMVLSRFNIVKKKIKRCLCSSYHFIVLTRLSRYVGYSRHIWLRDHIISSISLQEKQQHIAKINQ